MTVTASVTRDAVTSADVELGTRGRRLWRQMTSAGAEMPPGELVLLEEACRIVDRLDHLDRILSGDADAWMRFAVNDGGTEVTVVIDKALSEARQQQVALKQLLGEIRQSRGAAAGSPGTGRPAQPSVASATAGGNGVSGVADLVARIAAKGGAQASG